jgi:hypothetical protein
MYRSWKRGKNVLPVEKGKWGENERICVGTEGEEGTGVGENGFDASEEEGRKKQSRT